MCTYKLVQKQFKQLASIVMGKPLKQNSLSETVDKRRGGAPWNLFSPAPSRTGDRPGPEWPVGRPGSKFFVWDIIEKLTGIGQPIFTSKHERRIDPHTCVFMFVVVVLYNVVVYVCVFVLQSPILLCNDYFYILCGHWQFFRDANRQHMLPIIFVPGDSYQHSFPTQNNVTVST